MGEITTFDEGVTIFQATELSEGWVFKQTDDDSDKAWLPVKKVPSTVHQDLIDNKKSVTIDIAFVTY